MDQERKKKIDQVLDGKDFFFVVAGKKAGEKIELSSIVHGQADDLAQCIAETIKEYPKIECRIAEIRVKEVVPKFLRDMATGFEKRMNETKEKGKTNE